MNRRLIHSMLAAASALAPLALLAPVPAAAQSVMRPANEIVLSIGRGQLVTVPGALADIFISKDEVADVQIKSQRQLYIFGKAGGET
ncbi:MAG TPA: pilus assembly protein N-terminal domain-containing protein, partial [Novosphingobium sp.]|nr:pilus assembly protein N-terminal domain-containing protein [Novosphingobium sp.]